MAVRVYQVAKELKVTSGLLLEMMARLGRPLKSDLSVLDADAAAILQAAVNWAIESEKRRLAHEQRRKQRKPYEAPAIVYTHKRPL